MLTASLLIFGWDWIIFTLELGDKNLIGLDWMKIIRANWQQSDWQRLNWMWRLRLYEWIGQNEIGLDGTVYRNEWRFVENSFYLQYVQADKYFSIFSINILKGWILRILDSCINIIYFLDQYCTYTDLLFRHYFNNLALDFQLELLELLFQWGFSFFSIHFFYGFLMCSAENWFFMIKRLVINFKSVSILNYETWQIDLNN